MDVVRLAQYANADLWQIPEIFSWMLLAIISISIGVLIARRSEVFSRRDVFLIFEIALIWVVTYLVGLLAARSMQNIDLDTRMLSVVVPLVLVIPVALFSLAPQGLGKSLLGISVALWAGFQVYHGVERIGTIKESWEKHGAPGNVNLLFYNSVTSPAFDIFRVFRRLVTPDVEDLVLTDYRDVRVVGYFSGRATTVRFPSPDVIGEEGVRLEAKGRVFLVIRDPRNWEAITGLFGGVGVKELARVEGTPSGRIGELVRHGER